MKSRYALWMLPICCVGLAGCANWQNRIGSRSPGSAATMAPPPASSSGSLFSAPGAGINEPPPPMAPLPSDPNSSLAPLGGPQKLNLSSVSSESDSRPVTVRPEKMYNLESSSRGSRESVSSSEPHKSSTISKLASKANGSDTGESKAPLSTVKKLSTDAEKSVAVQRSQHAAKPQPATAVVEEPLPHPAIASPAPKTADQGSSTEAAVDTTLLAQPVRKGSGDNKASAKESKGPQSRVIPDLKFFDSKAKPAIYPVSNPVSEEPVNVIKFS